MGEIMVLSSDDGTDSNRLKSSETVQWEKYLPKTVLRVLLVESDDSTRQIITALLRKCSYKVVPVSDGLAAWEILKDKEKSHNIDVILTELDLPSISGFALLALVMEHEACKNIPVIMMSSQDSITMVLKCMLRGAADYLIKPMRKNELKNLWQHVWRRITLRGDDDVTTGHAHSLPNSKQKNIEDSDETSGDSRYHSDQGSGAPQALVDVEPMDESIIDKKDESFVTTMDLIGGIDKGFECLYDNNALDESVGPELGLSLKRSCFEKEDGSSKLQKLSLSDVSAFSRYEISKPIEKPEASSSSGEPKTPSESHEKLTNVSATTSSNKEGSLLANKDVEVGSLSNTDERTIVGQSSGSVEKPKEEESLTLQQRWSQREAALIKFRMKRKERCFDKKVRYQSRKKLAEQRPRVKGQFVRALNSTQT